MTALFRLQRDADLSARNTFGVAARAPWLLEVNDTGTLAEALDLTQVRDLPLLMLGGGSNLLFAGDATGVAVAIGARDVAIVDDRGDRATVRADAGAGWHRLVLWSPDGACADWRTWP